MKSGASKELLELANKMDIPVTTTLLGLGAFPENHELSLGMLGMHGTVPANYATDEADLGLPVSFVLCPPASDVVEIGRTPHRDRS